MNEFKKKQGTRIALSLLAVAVAVLFLTGIIGGKAMTYQLGVNENAVTAVEKGFGGDVTVHAELDGKKVKSLSIDTPDETEGLGKRASDKEFTDQFVGKEGPFTFGENGVEAISGATVTSNAALKALNGLITGEKPAAEKAEAAPAEEKPAATEAPAAETPAGGDESVKMASQCSEQGFGGPVTVHVETDLDTQKVISLTIDTPDETDGLGKRASEAAFTDQFIGKAGPFTFGENGIEALSGATVTSNAALKAINRTFTAEETTEEKPAEEKPAEEKPAEEKNAETAEDTGDAYYGSYLSEKETDFSIIQVLASVKDGKITDVKITSEAKSDGSDFLTDEVKAAWAKAIVESQSADNDTISGATLKFSAGAVKDALAEIQGLMAGEAAPAEEAETVEEKPAETEQPAEEQPAEEPKAEEPKEEESAKQPAAYGGYLAEKETDFSKIRMIVTTRNGVITDCRIRSEAKSEGTDFLTDAIRDAWAKAIVENQTAETDAISGATLKFSAGAVKEAVAEILEKAQGK